MRSAVVFAGLLFVSMTSEAQPKDPSQNLSGTILDASPNPWDPTLPPVVISVVPIKKAFDPWDPVVLYIEAQNVSDKPVTIDAAERWDIQVLQEDGKKVPWTRYAEMPWRAISQVFDQLGPGDVESFMVQLDRWVDLSLAGSYSVILRRSAIPAGTVSEEHPMGEEITVSSNRVKFRIEETSWLEMQRFKISEDVMRKKNLPEDFGRRRPSDGPR